MYLRAPAASGGRSAPARTSTHTLYMEWHIDQVIDSLFQLLVKYDHKFTLTSQ